MTADDTLLGGDDVAWDVMVDVEKRERKPVSASVRRSEATGLAHTDSLQTAHRGAQAVSGASGANPSIGIRDDERATA